MTTPHLLHFGTAVDNLDSKLTALVTSGATTTPTTEPLRPPEGFSIRIESAMFDGKVVGQTAICFPISGTVEEIGRRMFGVMRIDDEEVWRMVSEGGWKRMWENVSVGQR
jgi:hypothetical protein